jgi:hypothetical protein
MNSRRTHIVTGFVLLALLSPISAPGQIPDEFLTDNEKIKRERVGPPAQPTPDEFRNPFPVRGVNGIPGFPCYPTVEETFSTFQTMAANNPGIAQWIDIGDSWLKTQAAGGYDLNVLKLTNTSIAGPKPALFLMSSLHAREYSPVGLTTWFALYLIVNYGTDADVTWLLDYHEIHILFYANPDGRKQAETGILWRKNANNNFCSDSNDRGVDLNRNFPFQWSCCGGSSGTQCSTTYRGPLAASETETQAIISYLQSIFPDQRGPLVTDPAPADATGVFIDIHSFGNWVLWPYGYDTTFAPNHTALQTLGRKFAWYNNYSPEKASQSFNTDGTTDDFAYGDLGVAAYTFEIGTDFFEPCSFFNSNILPNMLPALIEAAKVARAPYQQPAGPTLSNLALPFTYNPGFRKLTAVADDTQFQNSNGVEPVQNIAAAEYYIDIPPWAGGATPHAMTADDGSYDNTSEALSGFIDLSSLTPGQQYTIFVRAQDANGNWGSVSAIFLKATAPPLSINPLWSLGAILILILLLRNYITKRQPVE